MSVEKLLLIIDLMSIEQYSFISLWARVARCAVEGLLAAITKGMQRRTANKKIQLVTYKDFYFFY